MRDVVGRFLFLALAGVAGVIFAVLTRRVAQRWWRNPWW